MHIDTLIDSRVESILNKGNNLETIEDYILGYLSSSHFNEGYHRLLLDIESESFIIEHAIVQVEFKALKPYSRVLVDEFSSIDQIPFQRPDIDRDTMVNHGSAEMMQAICDEVSQLMQ